MIYAELTLLHFAPELVAQDNPRILSPGTLLKAHPPPMARILRDDSTSANTPGTSAAKLTALAHLKRDFSGMHGGDFLSG